MPQKTYDERFNDDFYQARKRLATLMVELLDDGLEVASITAALGDCISENLKSLPPHLQQRGVDAFILGLRRAMTREVTH